jgi:hypothetical protein
MKAMKIDFAPRSAAPHLFHIHPAVLALAGAGALLCAAAAFGGWQLAEQRREREHQLQHLQDAWPGCRRVQRRKWRGGHS